MKSAPSIDASSLSPAREVIAAQDASFLLKSGKATSGLGKFHNGCANRPEKGLEIITVAVIVVTQNGAYSLPVEQLKKT